VKRAPSAPRLALSWAWVAAFACAWTVWRGGAPAHAQAAAEAPRVLLVIEAPDDPFANRVRAELSSMGLEVLTREPWRTGNAAATLEAAARAEGAVAAVRTVPSRKGVEIWMADRVMGRPLLRQLVIDESPGGPNQSLIALQTAELLRTSLLAHPPPPPPPAAPPVVIVEPASPPAAQPITEHAISAGVGGLWSPGGAGGATQLWLTLQQTLGRRSRWGELALDFSGPARGASLSGPEGSATVQTYLVALALLARMELPASRMVLDAGIGAGVVRVSFDGRTTAPLVARSDATTTAAGYARAQASFEVARWLRLGARAVGGFAARGTNIHFAGNDAGGWGPAFAALFVLGEVCWR
jgi:hypothetical protein